MGIILWIILGLIAGWAASLITGNANRSIVMDIVLGVIGALIGGFIMNLFGQQGVTGFNVYSILLAIIGAVILISIGRFVRFA